MGKKFDLVIVGLGPAGMAAAVEAAGHKLSVLVLDEQPEEGGQIYRSVSTTERLRPESYTLLGDDYQKGKKLQFSFQQTGVKYLSNAIVWNIEPDMTVNYLHNGSTQSGRSITFADCDRRAGTSCTDSRMDTSGCDGSSSGRCAAQVLRSCSFRKNRFGRKRPTFMAGCLQAC